MPLRVREDLCAVRGADLVRGLELLLGEEDFASHLEGERHGQPLGQALDGADDVADVLAVGAVAPGDDPFQPAGAVAGGDGRTIHLGLDGEPADGLVAEAALQGGAPGHEAGRVEDVVEAEQSGGVRDVAGRGGAVPDQAGRGIRGDLCGVRLLPGQNGEAEPVVGGVVDGAVTVAVVRPRRIAQAAESGFVVVAAGHAGQRLIGVKALHVPDPAPRV